MSESYDLPDRGAVTRTETGAETGAGPGTVSEAATVPLTRAATGTQSGADPVIPAATGPGTQARPGPRRPLTNATSPPASGTATPQPAPEAPRPTGPLGVAVGMTGNAEVDAVVVRLGDADELPTEGHIEVYEDVHQGLRDALAALDENRG